jgi:hypothetical protein
MKMRMNEHTLAHVSQTFDSAKGWSIVQQDDAEEY